MSGDRRRELLRRRLRSAGLAGAEPGPARIPPRPGDEDIPLSFAQSRMWFLQQLDPHCPAYNVCLAITLRGELDVAALHTALAGLVARHEVLRTRYVVNARDIPVQVVDPPGAVPLPVTDLRELGAGQRDRRGGQLAREESATPFDLATDHPMRVRLLHRGPDEWVLVLTVHHIAWDGGTFNALSADLSALYRAALTGEPAGLGPLPVQYADVACWQRATWTDEYLAGHLDYWRHRLTPPPEPLPLPTDAPRPAVPAEHGGRRHHEFGSAATEQLLAFGRRTGVTPYMTLLAGLGALLHRYTGCADIPIGAATMNRDDAELQRLIGNFGNTLVLRLDVAGDPSFGELVDRVRRVCSEGYAHQDLPFDKLVEALRPPRHGGRAVFFDVMLLFLTQGLHGPELPGVRASWRTVHNDTTQFDLALEAFLTGGRLRIEATHRSELFTAATVDRLLGQLETLLTGAIAEPGRRVSRIDVLTPAERELVLRQCNDTAEPMPATTLRALVEQQVRRTPRHTAVEYGPARLSYAELDARANQLAHRLVALGAGPERCVGVHLERSVEMVVGILATLKAGAAFVPVQPSWPQHRIAGVCANAQLAVLLHHPDSGPIPDGIGVAVLRIDLTGPVPDADGPDVALDPEGLAYVIYTSGSTGVPKGAMIRHRAIAHRLVWQRGLLGFGTGDAALFKAPLGFDISINEIFLPLVTGARLVIAEPGGERDTEYLLDTICRHRVTFVYLVSSMLDLLLSLDGFAERARSLQHVWCGGEVLTPELFDRFRAAGPAVLYHGYGPAEATIGVSHVVYRDTALRNAISIGRPNSNTRLYVLDRGLAPVPIGVPGELYAGGVYLGRGYLNDPRRTAAHFVADPFGPPGSRLYRTGDLARWRPDGTLEFLGRADNQVKIRGMRVELEEIEAVLEQHEQLRRAVVVLREDTPGVRRLVGYGLARRPDGPAHQPDGLAGRLRDWLAQRVPEHMVPQAFVVLGEFPLLASGKVDRARLPAPLPAPQTAGRAPDSAAEKILCELFAEVLGLPAAGVQDNFFALGGDSIISVRLVIRARKAGVRCTPRQIFEHPTPAGLAAVAAAEPLPWQEPDDAALGEVALTPVMRWARADASAARSAPRSGAATGDPYGGLNQAVLLVAPAGLGGETLTATLQAVLDRHDMLRARLEHGSLVVPPPGTVRAAGLLTRLAGSPSADSTSQTSLDEVAAAARDRLDPAAGRMLEAVWFDPGEHRPGRVLLVAHHLVIDWVSWSILTTDLAQAWAAVCAGRAPSLPRTGTSFRRWTQVLAEQARRRRGELPLWTQLLDTPGAAVTDRPLDPARDVVATLQRAELVLPARRAEPLLSTLPAAYYAGVPEVLLTGLALACRPGAGSGEHAERALLVGLEGHGRAEQVAAGVDLSGTVGWFTTWFPVRLDPGPVDPEQVRRGGPDAGAALKRIKEQVRAAPDQGLGYGLLRHLNPHTAEALAALPEPAVVFNYLGRFGAPDEAPWQLAGRTATFRLPPHPDHTVRVALDVNAMAVEGSRGTDLHITVQWPAAVAARSTVEGLLRRWEQALHGLAEHAAEPSAGGHTPSDLPLVSLTQEDLDEFED